MIHIYGIKNCDTVKKALKFIKENNIEHEFHDFKKEGLAPQKAEYWINHLGAETLINKRGTTYRKLDDTTKAQVEYGENVVPILQENTSLIKRPVIENNEEVTVGFTEEISKKIKV